MNTTRNSSPNNSTNRRFAKSIAAVAGGVLVGTLALGSVASAASGDPAGGARQRPTAAEVCADQAGAEAKMAAAKAKVETRIAELTTKRADAEAAGKTQAVTRIDKRLERLNKMLTRIDNRIAKFPTWVANHCD
jgi:hypothetical protein